MLMISMGMREEHLLKSSGTTLTGANIVMITLCKYSSMVCLVITADSHDALVPGVDGLNAVKHGPDHLADLLQNC